MPKPRWWLRRGGVDPLTRQDPNEATNSGGGGMWCLIDAICLKSILLIYLDQEVAIVSTSGHGLC